MSSATAPKALAQIEPIEPLYDANGTITGFLAINHPALVGGVPPPSSVQLQQLDANFATVTTFATKLTGSGSNFAGGDFRSLGISTGNVWLYVDSSNVYALDLTTGVTTPLNFSLSAGDIVQGRAVFDPADGTKAYAAFASTATVGSYIIRIDTTTRTVTATQTRDVAGAGGITLIGATSNDGSGITSAVKSSLTGTTSLTGSLSLSAPGRVVDDLMGSNGSAGPPPAVFLVGDTVYFTVADASAVGSTGFAKQAFSVNFNGTATPGAATAVLNSASAVSVSAVLGVVAPSPIPTSGPITYSGALVMTGGSNNTTVNATLGGGAAFANGATSDGWPITQASLGLYGAGGVLTRSIGTLSMNNVANSTTLTRPITGVALNNGPVQAGMPALLELYGKDGTGNPSTDIAAYATDASIPLTQLSGFDQ
jgi:hypothetical protein